jgi:hypothetical protein
MGAPEPYLVVTQKQTKRFQLAKAFGVPVGELFRFD